MGKGHDSSMRTLTDSFSASSLNATGGSAGDVVLVGSSGRKQAQEPRRKMKIMKRRSNEGGNTGNGKDKKNQGRGNKGKKLSEKEKAYAEAMARIFNELEERRRAEGLSSVNLSDTVIPP